VQSIIYPWVKAGILGIFLLVLALLIFSGLNQEPAKYFLISLLVFLTAVAQLWINHPETFRKNSRIGLIFGAMLFHLRAAKLVRVFCSDPGNGLPPKFGVLVVPYALAPLVLSVLLGKNFGLYAAVFVSLWSSILFRGVDAFLLVMSLISGFIAVFVTLQGTTSQPFAASRALCRSSYMDPREADAVESASRSLHKPTPQKIEQLVTEIVNKRIAGGQLDECDLALKEIRIISETFRYTIQNMLHIRIKYPKDEERAESESRRLKNLPPASAA
jgi:membrane-associated HD superfamily phosphohydrolase